MSAELQRKIFTCERNADEWRVLKGAGPTNQEEAAQWDEMATFLRGLGQASAVAHVPMKEPTATMVSECLQRFRKEIALHMEVGHPSSSPGHDSMRIALRAMLAKEPLAAAPAASEQPKSKLSLALDKARNGDAYKMQGAVFACDDIASKETGDRKRVAEQVSKGLEWLLDNDGSAPTASEQDARRTEYRSGFNAGWLAHLHGKEHAAHAVASAPEAPQQEPVAWEIYISYVEKLGNAVNAWANLREHIGNDVIPGSRFETLIRRMTKALDAAPSAVDSKQDAQSLEATVVGLKFCCANAEHLSDLIAKQRNVVNSILAGAHPKEAWNRIMQDEKFSDEPAYAGGRWTSVPLEIDRAHHRPVLEVWNACMAEHASLEMTWPKLVRAIAGGSK